MKPDFIKGVLKNRPTPDRSALITLALISLIGLWMGFRVKEFGLNLPEQGTGNVFYYLFCRYEMWMSLLSAVLAFSAFWYIRRFENRTRVESCDRFCLDRLGWKGVVCLACLIFCLTWWGGHAIYRNFPLSMDEYAACFQAEIFTKGRIQGIVPEDLRVFDDAIIPLSTAYADQRGTIMGAYLPMHALALAVAVLLGDGILLGAFFNGASLLLLYSVARLWSKGDGGLAAWSVVFMASCSQIWITGMSYYAMPAHLFVNLLWLWLYMRANDRCFLLLPWVGFVAIGLHQPHCHLLFVAPFLWRLVWEKKWPKACYAACVYGCAVGFWAYWMEIMRPEANEMARALFVFPGPQQLFIQGMNLCLTINWMPFVVLALLIIAIRKFKEMDAFTRDLLSGVLLTVFFHFFFVLTQGHGWGYRYLYPVLGNVFILSAWGLSKAGPRLQWERIAAGAVGIALLIQFPVRAFEVNSFIKNFSIPYEKICGLDADFVVLDVSSGWYAQDLVRNEPDFKNRPLLLYHELLTAEMYALLKTRGRVIHLQQAELNALGLYPSNSVKGNQDNNQTKTDE